MLDHGLVEFFIEGTRSRSGMTMPPKTGLLRYALELINDGTVDDIFLVPVTINYDRVLEAESYPAELLGQKKVKEGLLRTLKAINVQLFT
jgi:glycerol-3-phosphate O-acyltransferase